MSRSNHLYYPPWDFASTSPGAYERVYKIKTKFILGRRSYKRKSNRYPDYSINSWHSSPPRWWWQEQHARARRIYTQILRREEDPILPREKDLINLWNWY